MQREWTATLGTVGATHVRFLFSFPFALFVSPGVVCIGGLQPAGPAGYFLAWVVFGADARSAPPRPMLSVMGERSFVITYAYIKTEPVQVALFGLIFLGDRASAFLSGGGDYHHHGRRRRRSRSSRHRRSSRATRSAMFGILSGSLFALSAVGYRGAILSLELPQFAPCATTLPLAVGLVMQAALLSAWLALARPRRAHAPSPQAWKRRHCWRASWGLASRILVSRLRHRHGGQCAHSGIALKC